MDDFSKKIKNRFKEEFPEWAKYCSTVSPNGEPFLEIKIYSWTGTRDVRISCCPKT
jgi:hypothetical protein